MTIICTNPDCKKEFCGRKGTKYCSEECRYAVKNTKRPKKEKVAVDPEAKKPKTYEQTRNYAAYELAFRMAESYYNLRPQQERLDYLHNALKIAFTDNQTRKALTIPALLKPKLTDKSLFHRDAPHSNLTICEIMNNYCMQVYGVSTNNVLKNKPEMIEPQQIDSRSLDLRGFWKSKEEYPVKNELEIDTAMEGRKSWLTDYYMQLSTPNEPIPYKKVA